MNNSKQLIIKCANYRQKSPLRNFHSVQILCQQQPQNIYYDNPTFDSSLFFTNLPNKRREKQVKEKIPPHKLPTGSLVINCKRKEFNHYSGMYFRKFDVVPLASKAWTHKKSSGDYFTILPTQMYSPFVTKEGIPETFESCGISNKVIEGLKKINVTRPTAIQAKVLEKILSGENVFMFAECGSGKTIAYVVAMIENILKWKDKVPTTVNSPLGIVVTPARELALQVMKLFSSLGSDLGLNCQALMDGHSSEILENPEMRPVDILVCTASVINKHLRAGIYSTKYCKHVVIDDADAFEIEEKFQLLQRFLNNSQLAFTGLNSPYVSSKKAQICFVSAVAPSTLKGTLSDVIKMNDVPVISTPYLHKVLCTVPQHFNRISGNIIAEELLKLAKSNTKRKIATLIFSNTNKTCNWAAMFLKENGVDCVTMNKKDRPSQRMENFRNFELGFMDILSATNMLSLGFHFPRVKHVINLEFPRYMADYIHRCGRVGRLGQSKGGLITNFIRRRDKEVELVQKIEKAVRTNSVLPTIYCPKTYYASER